MDITQGLIYGLIIGLVLSVIVSISALAVNRSVDAPAYKPPPADPSLDGYLIGDGLSITPDQKLTLGDISPLSLLGNVGVIPNAPASVGPLLERALLFGTSHEAAPSFPSDQLRVFQGLPAFAPPALTADTYSAYVSPSETFSNATGVFAASLGNVVLTVLPVWVEGAAAGGTTPSPPPTTLDWAFVLQTFGGAAAVSGVPPFTGGSVDVALDRWVPAGWLVEDAAALRCWGGQAALITDTSAVDAVEFTDAVALAQGGSLHLELLLPTPSVSTTVSLMFSFSGVVRLTRAEVSVF